MAAKATVIALALARFPGVNNSELQEQPVFVEVPDSIANADTFSYVYDAAGDLALPPHAVQVYTHTGGDITNTVDATWAVNSGDTIEFMVDERDNYQLTSAQMKTGKQKITHTLAGGTNGAYTAAQLAASIIADTALRKYVYPVAGLTANRVSLFPAKPYVAFNVSGGTAQTVISFPGTEANWAKRTYAAGSMVIAGGTGWSWSYNATTRTVTITNGTGGAVSRVAAIIRR